MTLALRRVAPRRSKTRGYLALWTGGGMLGALAGLSLLARLLLDNPNAQELTDARLPPLSAGHFLGTDVVGRDLLVWCANGIVTSLIIGILVTLVSALVGTVVGAYAGYMRGWVEALLMRLVDLQLAVPPLLIFLAASMMIQASVTTMVILLASVAWVPYARLVRAKVVVEREQGYIAAARLAGAGRINIVFGHLVPASATPIVVFASLQVGFVILTEGALSFLGLGLQPPTASLGYMIAEGRDQLAGAWWIATVPGVIIVLLVVSVHLIGDGLRDRFHGDLGGVV